MTYMYGKNIADMIIKDEDYYNYVKPVYTNVEDIIFNIKEAEKVVDTEDQRDYVLKDVIDAADNFNELFQLYQSRYKYLPLEIAECRHGKGINIIVK